MKNNEEIVITRQFLYDNCHWANEYGDECLTCDVKCPNKGREISCEDG